MLWFLWLWSPTFKTTLCSPSPLPSNSNECCLEDVSEYCQNCSVSFCVYKGTQLLCLHISSYWQSHVTFWFRFSFLWVFCLANLLVAVLVFDHVHSLFTKQNSCVLQMLNWYVAMINMYTKFEVYSFHRSRHLDLLCVLNIASPSLKMTNCPWNGRSHVT